MYDTLRRAYYQPHMSCDVYSTAAKCESCVQNESRLSPQDNITALLEFEPLNVFATDTLRLWPETNEDNEYICVMTDR